MKFKVTKIATAVAVGLGVSAAGMTVARADSILFPYFAVSDTVTSVVTSINLAGPSAAVSATNPQTLHYRFFYKSGTAANGAPCVEFDTHRITSANDIVTFDLGGHYENKSNPLSVLAEPANRQTRVDYNKDGKSFAMMKGLQPARGFMLIDNDDLTNVPFEGSIFGEIMLVDFAGGAVWGYQAYNSAPNLNVPFFDDSIFSDSRESAGEVIAGNRALLPDSARNGSAGAASPPVPVNILPIHSDAGDPVTLNGDVFTRFFVTPILSEVLIANTLANPAQPADLIVNPIIGGNPGQQQNPAAISTQVRLTVQPYTGTASDVMFDRDERPVSGQVPQTVTCVGAVRVQDLVSSGALLENGEYGGWGSIQISSPGPLLTGVGPANAAGTTQNPVTAATRTLNTNQATVIELQYNPDGSFIGERFKGAFNNAIWLRYGYRESIITNNGVVVARLAGTNQPVNGRTLTRSALTPTGYPIDVGADFAGTQLSVQQ